MHHCGSKTREHKIKLHVEWPFYDIATDVATDYCLYLFTIWCLLQDIKLDLSPFSGVALRVKGDGQTFKINIKTEDRGNDPESTYAATFETTGKLLSHQGVMERQSLIFTLTASYGLQEIRCPQILGISALACSSSGVSYKPRILKKSVCI